MTKNNLKVVKSTKDQEADIKEKNKALDAAINQITDNFGKGSVMKLGQKRAMDIESISTGSLSLDLALGIGGLPKGRIIEVYGPESSGKTTLALQVVAEAQKAGGICAFVDAEHALDPVYAKKLGVNTEELLISQPDAGEQALEIADTLVKSGSISVIVIDSVAALVPKSEIEGDTIVRTQILRPSGGTPIGVDYRVRKIDGAYKVVDVNVEGISMLHTHRVEFASVINRKGMEGLLEELRTQVEARSSNSVN